MAFVENKNHSLVAQGFELFFVGKPPLSFVLFVAFAVFVQSQAKLLDRRDNDFVGVVV